MTCGKVGTGRFDAARVDYCSSIIIAMLEVRSNHEYLVDESHLDAIQFFCLNWCKN